MAWKLNVTLITNHDIQLPEEIWLRKNTESDSQQCHSLNQDTEIQLFFYGMRS